MKKIIAMLMVLAMALSLCACGGEKAAGAKAPETETPAEKEIGYTVTVLDETGEPVSGAMVQLCKDACFPGVTDEEGVTRFVLSEDTYKVSFLALPAGYAYVDETREFYFEDGSTDMTITLKAAATE